MPHESLLQLQSINVEKQVLLREVNMQCENAKYYQDVKEACYYVLS